MKNPKEKINLKEEELLLFRFFNFESTKNLRFGSKCDKHRPKVPVLSMISKVRSVSSSKKENHDFPAEKNRYQNP